MATDNAMSKDEYRGVREWLDHEGLDLIAPVHGKVKGDWPRPDLLTVPRFRPVPVQASRS
jgi:hypothetical protein